MARDSWSSFAAPAYRHLLSRLASRSIVEPRTGIVPEPAVGRPRGPGGGAFASNEKGVGEEFCFLSVQHGLGSHLAQMGKGRPGVGF